jgi:hypothetical protein
MYCPIWVKFGSRKLCVILLSFCDFVKTSAMKTNSWEAQMKYLLVYRDTDMLNVINTLVKSLKYVTDYTICSRSCILHFRLNLVYITVTALRTVWQRQYNHNLKANAPV